MISRVIDFRYRLLIPAARRNYSSLAGEPGFQSVLDLLSGSRSLPLGDLRGSRRPVGATRLPRAISPSTFSLALLPSWSLSLLSLFLHILFLSLSLLPDLPLHSQTSSDHDHQVNRGRDAYLRRGADRSLEWFFWPRDAMIYYARSQYYALRWEKLD